MSATLLSIDHLLHAAQLLEQNASINKLLVPGNYGRIDSELMNLNVLTALGEGYKEETLTTKLRSKIQQESIRTGAYIYPSNSTGTSRRSSPLSVPSSSSPSSPASSFSVTSPVMMHPSIKTPPMGLCSGSAGIELSMIAEHTAGSKLLPDQSPANQSSADGNCQKLSPSSRQSRAAHNELEKNRRANLRSFLDALKSLLPANDPDCSRDTTLSLLTRARNHISAIKMQLAVSIEKRNTLLAEHIRLRELLQETENNSTATPHSQGYSPTVPQHLEPQQSLSRAAAVVSSSSLTPISSRAPTHLTQVKDAFISVRQEGKRFQPDMNTLYINGLLQALPLIYPYTNQLTKPAC